MVVLTSSDSPRDRKIIESLGATASSRNPPSWTLFFPWDERWSRLSIWQNLARR